MNTDELQPSEKDADVESSRLEEVLSSIIQGSTFQTLGLNHDQLVEAQHNDPEWQDLLHECSNHNDNSVCGNFRVINNLLYKVDHKRGGGLLLVVPHMLIEDTLKFYHNNSLLVHPSQRRLYEIMRTRFYWSGMHRDITNWVAACQICIKHKAMQPKSNGLMIPIVTTFPFQLLGVDIQGPFKVSKNGYKYILVCVDHYTSWVEAIPLKTITAKEVIEAFFKLIIARHGCPNKLLTDQGKQFVGNAFREVCRQFNIDKMDTTAYHQQCNGKTERFNKFLADSIATELKKDQSNWDELLDGVLFTYRVSLNRTLNDNPFFLLYGRDPVLPQDLFLPLDASSRRSITAQDINEYKYKQLQILQQAYQKLNSEKDREQAYNKARYDQTHKHVEFEIGEKVMLYTPRTEVGLSTKFLPKWTGPYTILARISPVYVLVHVRYRND